MVHQVLKEIKESQDRQALWVLLYKELKVQKDHKGQQVQWGHQDLQTKD